MSELKTYAVWDAGTRWFHWINVLCVSALAIIGLLILNADALDLPTSGKLTLKTVHVFVGYVFALNLLWRIIWAFFGNRHARWSAILPGGKGYCQSVRSYITAFKSGHPEHYLGHNPLGRLGVSLLFLLMTIQAMTGLLLAGTDLFYPPLGHWIAQWVAASGVAPDSLKPYSPEMYDSAAYESMRAFRKPFVTIHQYNFYALISVVVLHIASVIITELKEGGSIISAMFTGQKIINGRAVDGERDSHN
ncbi:cytochrome b/b6 domain-containing protein [Methylicorpusculum sp.]|uniref:cytochrome b/b6 domain-containing protein n=1 Tax=Methylicorpusculum sp. TaxID=2713644 RepID=UPI002727B1E0|nr:cytochrome b/b6 domain-containing protein [Methylicorpusculum sp.]MDO8843856.1 cytochrome b/b6 domain-containing protein [Methylicorpusculum sp.]MDP2180602.1 cytochrome b/b6 domain-containing protein [Methylicorpusculum sp.]MDP3528869.1 cytochrome b/b6 domain-containing protein [Methylicorpusculum sp.]MDZ4150759.1 cytochrome b/b6 domain-containing protein [Methylicorpusculum sp.]